MIHLAIAISSEIIFRSALLSFFQTLHQFGKDHLSLYGLQHLLFIFSVYMDQLRLISLYLSFQLVPDDLTHLVNSKS